jgi:hypothetical protein
MRQTVDSLRRTAGAGCARRSDATAWEPKAAVAALASRYAQAGRSQ